MSGMVLRINVAICELAKGHGLVHASSAFHLWVCRASMNESCGQFIASVLVRGFMAEMRQAGDHLSILPASESDAARMQFRLN